MKTFIALLMLTAAAQAQSISGSCTKGSTAWTATLEECQRAGADTFTGQAGAAGASYFSYPSASTICLKGACKLLEGNLIPTTGVTVSAKPRAQCEDGWSLVDAGRPMCARELREPK